MAAEQRGVEGGGVGARGHLLDALQDVGRVARALVHNLHLALALPIRAPNGACLALSCRPNRDASVCIVSGSGKTKREA